MIAVIAQAARRRRTPPLPYPVPSSAPYNVAVPNTTPTYDGSGAAVHPDVLDMGTAWNGYRYWMAMTPYPDSNDAYENPSVLASHDGITWEVPPGLTNPIYPRPASGWNSDTDLCYDPATDELVMAYRGNDFALRVARSADGVTWPASPTLATATSVGDEAVSPAIIRISATEWHMWQVVKLEATGQWGQRGVYRWTATSPEGPWGSPTACTGFPANASSNPTIWHLDVTHHAGRFWMLAAEGREDENPSRFKLASSTDGIAWAYGTTTALVEGISDRWDRAHLYRGTLQPHDNGTHMRVWYGGRAGTGADSWKIGLTLIPLSEWP